MKCIVTGSDGFIGTNLCAHLMEEGHTVYRMDTKHGLNMFSSMPKSDVIYHLACVNQEAALRIPKENVLVNAYGAKYAAFMAKEMGAKLIYTSTASVYGQAKTIATPVDAELDPKTDYAVAKLAGEGFIRNSGCEYSIYRLSNVYGPGQTTDNPYCGVIGRFIEKAFAWEPLPVVGNGLQTRDYTYIDDVIEVLARPNMLSNRTENVSHSSEISVLDLVNALSDIFNRKLVVEYVKERGIDGISRRRLITDHYCSTDLMDGLAATVDWYRESLRKTGPGRPAFDRSEALSG